jgi:hypothetical protein
VTSTVTLLELLVQPYRRNDMVLVNSFYNLSDDTARLASPISSAHTRLGHAWFAPHGAEIQLLDLPALAALRATAQNA